MIIIIWENWQGDAEIAHLKWIKFHVILKKVLSFFGLFFGDF